MVKFVGERRLLRPQFNLTRRATSVFVSFFVFANLWTTAHGVADTKVRPEWIWAPGDRSGADIVELRTTLQLGGSVQNAHLRLATEFTDCQLIIGERSVLRLDNYGPWLDIDVTENIPSGSESLRLLCHSSDGPSAVALELVVRFTDGRRTVLRTGGDWKTQTKDGNKLTKPSQAASFGAVAEEYWDADRTARISSFDNYEQWRQASGQAGDVAPAKFSLQPGFEIERVRSAGDDEGSWVSMEFDSEGRLIVAREDQGLLRMSLSDDLKSVTHVEAIDTALRECRGLLFRNGNLYAQANNTKALFRVDIPDEDEPFESRTQLREFPGGVGHGRNDLALGPDNAIYAIFGDSVSVPSVDIVDFTSPFREARRGERTTEGHVLRFDPDDDTWSLFCSGLRNPFGISFNNDGEAFTYDADAEYDMGSPWYRPTRLVHLVEGGDYGWRGRTKAWPPYDADHADFTLPAGNIGKGSPTAVKSGQRSSFPEQYQRCMFALDWAYGRILACHLLPRGSGYLCRADTFLKGKPLNVTDLDFAPDGSMFFITGGRKTHSNLYRVRWTGGERAPASLTPQQEARRQFAESQRAIRRNLANWKHVGDSKSVIDMAWEHLDSADPMLRDAARVAVENQPIQAWKKRAFDETQPTRIVSVMLSMARSGDKSLLPAILRKLLDVPVDSLAAYDQSMLLETWSRCLSQPESRNAAAFNATRDRIENWYPDSPPLSIAPTGAGRAVNHQLGLLAEMLSLPEFVAKTVRLLQRARTQEERIHAIYLLRHSDTEWTPEFRTLVFETLQDLERTAIGGEGMPGFLKQIRDELTATLTTSEREQLGSLIRSGVDTAEEDLKVVRPFYRKWATDDIDEILSGGQPAADARRGEDLFRAAQCHRCHRVGSVGGVVGPNLTSVARRFGHRDILLSILAPSRVVDEKYRNTQIVTKSGRVVVGRIVTGGDYRSTVVKVSTDPLRPSVVVDIDKNDIEIHKPSNQSPMPEGLLDTFSASEIRDLLAFFENVSSP